MAFQFYGFPLSSSEYRRENEGNDDGLTILRESFASVAAVWRVNELLFGLPRLVFHMDHNDVE